MQSLSQEPRLAKCLGTKPYARIGCPDPKHISTSYIERQNLTTRMHCRRFTRLTNAFSKKIENHEAAISLHYAFYNFCRVHMSLRVTPAMQTGLTDHVWEMEELVALLEAYALGGPDENDLEKAGWIKISVDQTTIVPTHQMDIYPGGRPPTQKQHDVIWDWCQKHKRPFPKGMFEETHS